VLLSRLAENLYWAGRYLERAEATARIVRIQTELYLDLPRSVSVGWRPLLAITGASAVFDGAVQPRADEAADGAGGVARTEEHRVVAFLTTSSDNPGSVLSSIEAARQNLRSVRALLPRSSWEVVNRLHLHARETVDLAVPRRSRIEWLEGITRRCQTLHGMLDGTMSHDQAYAFLQVGRQIERADMTTRVIDVSAHVLLDHRIGEGTLPYADITWMGVLRAVSGMQMYRRVARVGVSGPRALQFLLCDPQFPRSVERCLTEVSRHALELPRHEATMTACAAAQQALTDCDVTGLSGEELHDLMDVQQRLLGRIHDAAATTWFPSSDPGPPVEVDVSSPSSQSQSSQPQSAAAR
jgi:uncharacterized alpha-E superfamily protein